jgi:hypothetical protein
MKPRRLLFIVVVLALAPVPTSALAGGRPNVVVHSGPKFGHSGPKFGHSGPRFGHSGRKFGHSGPKFVHPGPKIVVAPPSVFPRFVDPWQFWGVHPRHFRKPFHGSAVIPFAVPSPGFSTSAAVAYAAPAPVAVAVPEVPIPRPTMPTLIEYPNGYYELRGDGITVPYRWVWIPKPPPPPPFETPPAVAPPSEAPAPARVAEERPRKRSPIYRWTDERGVTTFTDQLDNVPEPYRDQAKAHPL